MALHLLLLILFCCKRVTNCLYFSFTYIFCHNLKYTFSTQCSSSNKNSTVDGFTYMHLLFNVNFTTLSLRIFTSSTSRSLWIYTDEAEVDCRIARYLFFNYCCLRFMWQWLLAISIISKNYIHIYPALIPIFVQMFVDFDSQSKFPS